MDRFGVVGISHRRSSVEEIGWFAKDPGSMPALRDALGVDELIRLATCNRVELYYVSHEGISADHVLRRFAATLHPDAPEMQELADASGYALSGDPCLRHLDSLLAGLDSLVLGDEQIVGQFRQALTHAREAEACGPWLGMLGDEALKFTRRLRKQVDYGRLPTSVPEVAADLIKTRLQGRGGRVVLVGAGETIQLLASRVAGWQDVALHLVNRDATKAEALAARHGGTAQSLEDFPRHGGTAQSLEDFRAAPGDFEVLVAATAAMEPVVRAADLEGLAAPEHPRLLLDLGVPADLEPALGAMPGFDRRDLLEIGNAVERHQEVAEHIKRQVRPYLREATISFREKIFRRHITPIAENMRRAVEERAILEADRWEATHLTHLSEEDRELFRAFALRLAEQTVQVPLVGLRKTLRELPMGELLIERMREAGRQAAKKTQR
ncbi:MAG: glutamyl-tRNA reductase [Planctomycetota bacterium]|jgi:glutamyl-tRNA reductase